MQENSLHDNSLPENKTPENSLFREPANILALLLIFIIVPAIIYLSGRIVTFNTYQPGRAQEVPTPTTPLFPTDVTDTPYPTNPPWIIIMTATPAPTITERVSACSDSDNGNNYYVSGITKGSGTGCSADGLSDSCFTASAVKEYYCGGQDECLTVYFNCPYGCQNGACLPSAPTTTPDLTPFVTPSVSITETVPSSIALMASPSVSAGSPTLGTENCLRRTQGDADCNGIIDLIDFEIWRENFVGGKFTLASDFESDGSVNLIDFEVWRLNFLLQ